MSTDKLHNLSAKNNIFDIHDYVDWYKKGVDACEVENFTLALGAFCKVIELEVDNIRAFIWRSFVYDKLGNYQKAIEDLNTIIDHFPIRAFFYFKRGLAYDKLGEYRRALEDFSKAIHLKPTYVDAYYNRALAYSSLEQYQATIGDFNKVIGLKPNYADAYFLRGTTHFLMGNNDLGYNDALKASKLGNNKLLEQVLKYGMRSSKL